MDESRLLERIHERVEEIHTLHVESRDFMPAVIGTLEAIGSVLKAIESRVGEFSDDLRDLREESRAQRQALLRMLDRMDGLDPGSSAA